MVLLLSNFRIFNILIYLYLEKHFNIFHVLLDIADEMKNYLDTQIKT